MSDHDALLSYLDDVSHFNGTNQGTTRKHRQSHVDAAKKALGMTGGSTPPPTEPPPKLEGINLVPTAIVVPAGIKEGDRVRASVVIANVGDTPTPPDTVVDVLLDCDIASVAWSDNITQPLGPGESRTQVMNGGPDGADGTFAMTAGTHALAALVNSGSATRTPIVESQFNNNRLTIEVTVAPGTVTVPPVEPPPIPPTGRQPLLAWVGWVDSNGFGRGGMKQVSDAGMGSILSLAGAGGELPSWLVDIQLENRVARGASIYLAKLMLDMPLLRASAEALRAIVDKQLDGEYTGLDMEPYPPTNHDLWRGPQYAGLTAKMAYDAGKMVGAIWAGTHCIVYTSSDANFEGSYNDLVQQAAGNVPMGTSAYADNTAEDFLQGMNDAGCHFTYQDASFHIGSQLREGWENGIKHSVALTTRRWPSQGGSVMTWPDYDEGSRGYFGAAEMQVAWESATRQSTGPSTMYHHTMGTSINTPQWQAWLDAAKRALATK